MKVCIAVEIFSFFCYLSPLPTCLTFQTLSLLAFMTDKAVQKKAFAFWNEKLFIYLFI